MKKILTTIIASLPFFATAQNISTVAGTGTPGFSGDGGAAVSAKINLVHDIAMDAGGNMYFTDYSNNRIRKMTAAGIISTIAGTGTAGFSGDGGMATAASINGPYGVCADASGNVFFTDENNHRVRKISTAGIISTLAGTGVPGYGGDGGAATAAQLWYPLCLCADGAGNIYVSDNQNQRIRRISPSGIITTYAGNGSAGFSGDGGAATSARINYPGGIAIDAAGNMFIADGVNQRVRKVSPAGIISTIAGTGAIGFSGDGGPALSATFNVIQGLGLDVAGNVYVTDYNNNRVRKINSSGFVSTIAGTGATLYNGDGIAATSANIDHPVGVLADASGIVYFSDQLHHRVRRIGPDNNAPLFVYGPSDSLKLCMKEAGASVDSLLDVTDADVGQTLTWSLLSAPSHGMLSAAYVTTSTGGVVTTSGTSYTPTAGYSGADMFKALVTDGSLYDTITIFVSIIPPPAPGVIAGVDSMCIGSSVILTASIPGGLWSHSSPGTAILGTTGVVSGLAAGYDTITYTVTNFCGSASAKYLVKVLPKSACNTGINWAQNADKIRIFPNPSDGRFAVDFPSGNAQARILLTDLSGKVLADYSVTSGSALSFNPHLASGIYIIHLQTDIYTHTQKLIISNERE